MLNYAHPVCAIDALGSTTTSKESELPEFPGEDPGQEAISTWLNKWDAHLASTGYAPLLGGHEPTSVAHLRERDLSSYPAPTADMTDKEKANLAWKRSELEHDNERIRHQKSELIKDHTPPGPYAVRDQQVTTQTR